jgi:hypothetical protein
MWPMRGSTADRRRSSRLMVPKTPLAGDEDASWTRRVVSAISLIDVDALDLSAAKALGVLDGGAQGVAVVGIARQCGSVQHELAAR